MNETMTSPQVDSHLDEVQIKQMLFKPSDVRNIMVKIVEQFLPDKIKWLDEVELPALGEADRNCIGSAWRTLAKVGILKRMDDFKRSTAKSRRGGLIFKYRMANESLARTFLKRNGWTPGKQPDLFS